LPGRQSALLGSPKRIGLPTALAVATICVGVLVLVFMVMNTFHDITFQQFGGATPFITLAGFAVTVIQLYNGNSEARASFLKTYTTDFILKPELYGTWHDLIYGYSNTVYAALDAHVRQHGAYPTEIAVPGEAAIPGRRLSGIRACSRPRRRSGVSTRCSAISTSSATTSRLH